MKVIAACVWAASAHGRRGLGDWRGRGAAIMASISRILVFIGFSSDYDDTITGILLIIIVVSTRSSAGARWSRPGGSACPPRRSTWRSRKGAAVDE
jgi:ribose/xylose/arabinose/galactoside ABC-type transport system permease subunit